MGRCMIYNVRPVCTEQIFQTVCIAHGTDQHHQIHLRVLTSQFLLDLIGIIFIYIKYNELFYLVSRQLPAQLAANGTTAPGDQDYLILYIAHDLIQIGTDRLPA